MDETIARKIIETNKGFIHENGYKLMELGNDYCKLEANIEESSLNPYNIVHGGFIFGLADTAGGIVAALSGRGAVTTSASISYLHKAECQKLYAYATCLKRGRTLCNCEVEIRDDKDLLVAKCTLEYFYI